MKASQNIVVLLDMFEANRLIAYQDSVGIWTIARGHTAAAGPPVPVRGMRITARESDAILFHDLVKFEAGVNKALKREATQDQFDAFLSLAWNIGETAFAKSSVVSRFNRGDLPGAAAAFLMWDKAGGKPLAGLARRRKAEKAMFNHGLDAARAVWAGRNVPEAAQRTATLENSGVSFDPDPAEFVAKPDAPIPPKSMASSKTGWASIGTAAGGVTALVSSAQPILDSAQHMKDTAGQAAGLFGIDGRLAILIGAAIVVVVGSAFIWYDRRRKLIEDGV